MSNPITNFKDSFGTDLGNKLITKEYLMSVYPQIARQLITPELWTWGNNTTYGQLGDNTTVGRSTPVTTFAGGATWKQVACGLRHTVAIKTDGTLWSFGDNGQGQLGVNDINRRSTPVTTFAGGTNWKQVSCGNFYTAAVKTDGTLWVWGVGSAGNLGNNDTNSKSTPVTTFAGGTNWKQVSCGTFHIAAVKTDGTLWTWGGNYQARLGINTGSPNRRSTPVTTFAGGTNWKQVSCGYGPTLAVKTDGTLWTWGFNAYGEVGDNSTNDRSTPVTTFAGGTNWKLASCGYKHVTAIKIDGTLWTWGRNSYGALGDNTTINRSTPVTTFAGGTNWKQSSGSDSHTAAIKTDGTLWTWGRNYEGQLGVNTTINRSTPSTTFAGGTNWKQVACGVYYTVAIKTSDDLLGI